MLAIKAAYDKGTVWLKEKPFINGYHDVLVIFGDVQEQQDADGDPVDSARMKMEMAISTIQNAYSNIPSHISLADELIAERRREAANE